MKKIFTLLSLIALLLTWTTALYAQCSGGRYHSMVFPGTPTVVSNIVYGSNLDQNGTTVSLMLDVYRPACDTATRRALVILAHGGSFVSGDKADAGYVAMAQSLAKLGYVVASINYRLGFPTSGLAAQYGFNSAIMRGLHDGRAAVRFMRNNALNGGNTYGVDPNNIFFGGVSAGGIIALHLAYQNAGEMTMNTGGQPGTNSTSVEGNSNALAVSSSVRGIISISGGIRDLAWITTNDVPVYLAHGTVDGTVPYGSGTFGGFFPVHGSSSIATRNNTTTTKYCFTPMINQDHTPTNTAYVDTLATLMRNFLEHFTCNIPLNCVYNGSPAPLVPAVSIAVTSGSNNTCTGSSVTFTATPTNAGTNVSYQWKKNGANIGSNSPTFTSTTLANNDVISVVMTTCASLTTTTSNSITMTISPAGAPTVAIAVTSGSNNTCTGASVTFTATPTNGGSSPSYQWKVNGANVGGNTSTFTSSALANNNIVTVVMTSNSSCANPTTATSNPITMTVSGSVAPAVAIALTSGSNPTCTGASVTFTATPTNGGSSPSYQWKVNGANVGGNTSTFTSSALANNNIVTVVMTSNSSCANPTNATSNPITMTVSGSVAPAVAIALTSGSNPTCTGASVTFTATPTNGGSSPSYQWKVNGANVGGNTSTFTSSALANNNIVTVVMTSNSSCASPTTATSNPVTMTVSATVAPTVAIAITSGTNPSCTDVPVTFTATPVNGGSSPSYQWKVNGANTGGNTSTLTSSVLANNNIVTVVMTSNSSCANPTTATSNAVTMTINTAPVITKNGNVLTASASASYQWYRNGVSINGAIAQSYTATQSGNYTVAGAAGCQSLASNVTISGINEPDSDYSLTVYPNPSNGNFKISFTAMEGETYDLECKSVTGATVFRDAVNGFTGLYEQQIDATQYAKGTYIIRVSSGAKEAVRQIVVF